MSGLRHFRWLPASASADSRRLLATRAMRGFADGLVSVVLPSYLTAIGFSSARIGAIIFGTLLGSALLTLWVGLAAHRVGRRKVLLAASALMLATGVSFATLRGFWPLFAAAVVGTLNPSAGDVSLFLPAEQAALAETVVNTDLTSIFALYNVAGALAGAVGALASGIPAIAATRFGWNRATCLGASFFAYAAIAALAALVYSSLSGGVDTDAAAPKAPALASSRRVVVQLSTLFSLDSFGGGFVVQSLLALWLFRRFNLPVQVAGALFFATGLLGAMSQFVSSSLTRRIGRIRTMVYTHVPSNLFLIMAALMPGRTGAIVCLLLRFSMSQMDVPARQSYVMALVPPEERAAAASVTNVPRSLAAALAPLPAGMMLEATSFGWPLVCAGSLKLIYDLLLMVQFRSLKPADER